MYRLFNGPVCTPRARDYSKPISVSSRLQPDFTSYPSNFQMLAKFSLVTSLSNVKIFAPNLSEHLSHLPLRTRCKMKQLVVKFKQLGFKFMRSLRSPKYTADRATPGDTLISDDVAESALEPKYARLESATEPKAHTAKQICDSGLESLPPEIRRHLLSTLDLPRLKALVRASPTFHDQYLLDRKYILCRSLQETWGSVTVDAYAVHQSAPQAGGMKQNMMEIMDRYSEQTSQRCLSLSDRLSLDEAVDMAVFYLDHVKPITDYFARWALDNLAEKAGNKAHDRKEGLELTRAESMRFTRATYRFQLLCQLTDGDSWGGYRHPMGFLQEEPAREIALVFLDVLEPWEIEELVSFHQWAHGVYDKVFRDIYWDVHQDNPKFDDQSRPPTPEGALDLGESCKSSSTKVGAAGFLRWTHLILE